MPHDPDHGHDHGGHDHAHRGHGHAHGHHHHGHDHDHHGHAHVLPGADPERALLVTLGLNGVFLFAEIAVGLWTGSLALLSDAAHMVSDVASLLVALGAMRLARGPTTERRTFGLLRFETLGAFVNGLGLFAIVGLLAVEAVHRLLGDAPHVEGGPVLVVGVLGLVINLGSAWALWRSDRENLNIRGALAHMLADAVGSVGAIVAAGLLMLGLDAADPAVSLALALLVAWGAWGVTRDAGRVLLQLPPRRFDVAHLLEDLLRLDGVVAVHDLHVWTLDGREPIVTAHLVAAPGVDALGLVAAATRLVAEHHGADHATIQVEAATDPSCLRGECGATGRRDAPAPG